MKLLFPLLILMLFFVSCGQQPVEDYIDHGSVSNGVYSNQYFNFTIDMPTAYVVASREATDQLMQAGQEVIEESFSSSLDRAVVKASEVNTMQLFMVSELEIGSPVEDNPNMICMIERVSHVPGIKKPQDYLYHSRKLMRRSSVGFIIEDEFEDTSLGGEDFSVMYAEIAGQKQRYYTTLRNGFALSFIVTYGSEETLDPILHSLNSLKMN